MRNLWFKNLDGRPRNFVKVTVPPFTSCLLQFPRRLPLLQSCSKDIVKYSIVSQRTFQTSSRCRFDERTTNTQYTYPERLLIFHGGTARIAFLASLKMTTVLVAGFFTFILAPKHVIMDATQPLIVPLAAAVCGIIPFAFVWRTTYPIVTYMHIRIPTYARTTRSALEKWVNRGVNPATEMEITSMTFLARPKQVAVKVGDLVPSNRMLGYANWRVAPGVDVNQGPLIRRGGKWWHAPPLKEFSISGFNRDAREGWVWTELGRQIRRRAVMKGLGEP